MATSNRHHINKNANSSSLMTMKLPTNNRRGSLGTVCYGENQQFSAVANINCIRKSSINLPNSFKVISNEEDMVVNCSKGRYSPHPNEIFVHPTKLSIHPISHYEEPISCCLPPPSPAPISDRLVIKNGEPAEPSDQMEPNYQIPSNVLLNSHSNKNNVVHNISSSASASSLSTMTSSSSTEKNTASQTNTSVYKKNTFLTNIDKVNEYSPNSSRIKCSKDQISPSSDYISSSNNYNKCSNNKYLSYSTSLIANENYNYLSSAVHTPVKRYVPTPPPSNEVYHHFTAQQVQAQNSYRVHLKCCSDLQKSQINIQKAPPLDQSSHFNEFYVTQHTTNATPAPTTYIGTPTAQNPSQNISTNSSSQSSILSDHCKSKQPADTVENPTYVCNIDKKGFNIKMENINQNQTVFSEDNSLNTLPYISSFVISNKSNEKSLEDYKPHNNFIEDCDIRSFQNKKNMQQAAEISSLGKNSSIEKVANEYIGNTCLHCNNVRRKTGVHRTTQTTGPISPTPIAQSITSIGNNFYCSKNDTNCSPISPLSTTHTASRNLEKAQHELLLSTNNTKKNIQINQEIFNGTSEKDLQYSRNSSLKMNLPSNPPSNTSSQHQVQTQQRVTRKRRFNQYIYKKVARFFGVETLTETDDFHIWQGRQRRFALRRFGGLKNGIEIQCNLYNNGDSHSCVYQTSERPDILPDNDTQDKTFITTSDRTIPSSHTQMDNHFYENIERKSSVFSLILSLIPYLLETLNRNKPRKYIQWSRSFAPFYVNQNYFHSQEEKILNYCDIKKELTMEVFFDCPTAAHSIETLNEVSDKVENELVANYARVGDNGPNYLGERLQGWQTTGIMSKNKLRNDACQQQAASENPTISRGTRIAPQLLDGVLENSRRPIPQKMKLFSGNEMDDRNDCRPFFTYWINTVQIIVLCLSIVCYGIGPLGIGFEQKTGQVLVTSLSLQTVQHIEQQNFWIGPRNNDLVHLGAKFATCMRLDDRITNVLMKTRRQERDTACCIRNDDSGCVQSSQADCSVRGLFPTKSISTWKKWSPGESGPGGRISGSVCGLDPKFCDAPASIAPYEWPDDITKWPICRKTNSISQRFRYKDHTAEHMVCEVIGHPCCTGVFGECRITTREYCEFINGYFHEEASLCSQISCLNNVCGMLPFMAAEIPDQIYRLFSSLCLHAGIIHLVITVLIQHWILSDLERLMGSIRTAILYVCSGMAGNLSSAVLAPYKPEVGPSAALCGVLGSCTVLLFLQHWKHLQKPHIALIKILLIGAFLFALGTLPWQLNFIGLSVGIVSGAFLTLSLIPFISIGTYDRKSKINSIWTCFMFHFVLFAFMIVVFYIYPTELKNFKFGEVLGHSFDPTSAFGNKLASSEHAITTVDQSEQYTFQHIVRQKIYHHHHSDDIISNNAPIMNSDKLPNTNT